MFRFVCAIFLTTIGIRALGWGRLFFHTNLGYLEVNDFIAGMGSEKDSHKIEKFDGTNFSF